MNYIKMAQMLITSLSKIWNKWDEKKERDKVELQRLAHIDPIAKDKLLLDAERASLIPRVRDDVKPLVLKQKHPYIAAKHACKAYFWAIDMALKKSRRVRKRLAAACGLTSVVMILASAACMGCILILGAVWLKYHLLDEVTMQLRLVLSLGMLEAGVAMFFAYRISSRLYSSAELLRFR